MAALTLKGSIRKIIWKSSTGIKCEKSDQKSHSKVIPCNNRYVALSRWRYWICARPLAGVQIHPLIQGWKLNNWVTIIHYSLLFLQIIHYSFQIFPWYSLFIYLVFVSVFLSQIFYNAILYIVYRKFTFKYTFNLIFSKYHSIFSINVVKIIWCYPLRLIGRPCNY